MKQEKGEDNVCMVLPCLLLNKKINTEKSLMIDTNNCFYLPLRTKTALYLPSDSFSPSSIFLANSPCCSSNERIVPLPGNVLAK